MEKMEKAEGAEGGSLLTQRHSLATLAKFSVTNGKSPLERVQLMPYWKTWTWAEQRPQASDILRKTNLFSGKFSHLLCHPSHLVSFIVSFIEWPVSLQIIKHVYSISPCWFWQRNFTKGRLLPSKTSKFTWCLAIYSGPCPASSWVSTNSIMRLSKPASNSSYCPGCMWCHPKGGGTVAASTSNRMIVF